ncbi:MAG TPA: acyl-CoA dehydrogenase [Mycobacteriales bacterium]|jgi:alkylation response protein AidB-like acyl-CoA dehydrogenase|nr:acyl-CoA dehydrogenase [Mycobacteriales bacterium]
MYFLPTVDQLALQRGVRDLLDDRFPLDRLPAGYDAGLWESLTETGVFSLRSELGLGLADAVLVFEELGRAGLPGPLVGTFLLGGSVAGPVTVVDPDRRPLLVSHLDVAAGLLVLDTDGAYVAAPVTGVPLSDPVDPLTPLHELVAVPDPTATRLGETTAELRAAGVVLTAALQVGLAGRLTELAVDYAKTREQFGKPIGSFQAVKHLCADMFVRAELARAGVHSAAVMLDDPEVGDASRAVHGAKLLADEAATTNGRSCIQVHGGMGFTWEVPVHFFAKRAWLQATEFGTADEHAEDLAGLL